MRKHYNIYKVVMAMLFGVALSSCSDDTTPASEVPGPQNTGMPVLFSAGNAVLNNTRAATVLYMPNNVRFAAAMYYQESAHYNLNPWLAYLQVDEKGAGNSNYRQASFVAPEGNKKDNYDNDLDAHIFYWQNRQNHIFIGYIDNYNKAYANAIDASKEYVPDNLGSHKDFPIYNNDKKLVRNQMCKHFDLRNPKDKKESEKQSGETAWTKMSDQFDPLIACEEKQPTGAGGETNRVHLTFKHQFSQIQVNLKGHESVNLISGQIDAVELLGVSESADVFPFVDHKDKVDPVSPDDAGGSDGSGDAGGSGGSGDSGDQGNSGNSGDSGNPVTPAEQVIVKYDNDKSYIRTAEAGKVDLTQYTPEQQEANPYGTSFGMFKADNASTGYLKTFEAIAYGQLQALRIHWHELTEIDKKDKDGNVLKDDDENPIKEYINHIVTFVIPDAAFRELKSGMRYVFNLEIRRGTLAVVRAEIDDWVPYETVYYEDGTIEKLSVNN